MDLADFNCNYLNKLLENISKEQKSIFNKSNIYERDWSKFDTENFILDYFSVEWEDLLKINELNADKSTKKFLDEINMLLDTYAPLKRVKK